MADQNKLVKVAKKRKIRTRYRMRILNSLHLCVKETLEVINNVIIIGIDACGYDGVNLLNASDESAGQSVPHFHIHIIPRKKGDDIDAWPAFNGANYDIEELYHKLRIR